MVQIFNRLRNNRFYLFTLHVSTTMGHLQVFSVTHHLLLNYNARFIHVYLWIPWLLLHPSFLETSFLQQYIFGVFTAWHPPDRSKPCAPSPRCKPTNYTQRRYFQLPPNLLNAIFIPSIFLFLSVLFQFVESALKPAMADNGVTACWSVWSTGCVLS
jgi:hypothetical protein